MAKYNGRFRLRIGVSGNVGMMASCDVAAIESLDS